MKKIKAINIDKAVRELSKAVSILVQFQEYEAAVHFRNAIESIKKGKQEFNHREIADINRNMKAFKRKFKKQQHQSMIDAGKVILTGGKE